MATEQLDLEVAVEGFRQFMSKMGTMDGAIDKTGSRWGNLGSAVTASMQTIGTIGIAAIAGGAAVIGGLTLAIGKLALEAAPVEALSLAFAGLTEGMGVGTENMLTALQEGSDGMISQRDLMESFNKAAALVGDDFALMLPDAMGYMGKVAAATGQEFGFMLDSLVTGVGRLSPMILDNLAIQVSLSEATARAAEMFGVEEAALTKAQQQAGMMNVVMEKLAESTADMPEIAGTAAAGIAGMKAQFQDTKDAIGMAFLPVLNTLLQTFAAAADRYLPAIMSAVEEFAGELSGLIGFVITAVEEGRSLSWWLDMLPDSIRPIVDGVLALIETVSPFIETVVDWISENVKLQDVLIALGIAIASVIIPIIVTLISTIAPIIAVFAGVVLAIVALRAAWESNFLGIRTAVEAVIGFVTAFIGDALETIRAWWDEHGAAVMTIVDAFMGHVKFTIDFWIGVISGIIETILGAIQYYWDLHGASIMLIVETVWENIKTTIETIINTVQGIIQAVALAIEGDWEGFGEKLREIWEGLWEAVEEILERNVELILTVIGNLIDNIKRFFTDTDWGEVARSIIDGIVNGLRNGISAVGDAARQVAQAALDAAKGFLGIDSPSSIFIQVGQSIGEGLIVGIQSMATDVQASVTALVEAAMGTINEMLAFGQRVGGLGGGFAVRLREIELDPLEEQLEAITEEIEQLEALREEGQFVPMMALARLEERRTEMLREQARLQEVLLNLEKQRQDLTFLEQQVKLLDLIREYDLDAATILGGMEMGIDASTESLVSAMTAAMQQIIAGIETELQIASPSQRFAEIGSQMMRGIAQGISSQASSLQAQIQAVIQPPVPVTAGGNNFYDQRQYNLTTQSTTRPSGLAMEFAAIEMASR